MNGVLLLDDVLEALIAPIARQPVEIGVVLYIDAQGRLVGLRHVRGTRDAIDVPIRLFVADALAFEAHGAILAHNHPGGDDAASRDDLAVTRRLARAFEAVGVTLIDHIVLTEHGRTSLRAAGYL